jgi:hypothetical protein
MKMDRYGHLVLGCGLDRAVSGKGPVYIVSTRLEKIFYEHCGTRSPDFSFFKNIMV